jgi:hypothetical protein
MQGLIAGIDRLPRALLLLRPAEEANAHHDPINQNTFK